MRSIFGLLGPGCGLLFVAAGCATGPDASTAASGGPVEVGGQGEVGSAAAGMGGSGTLTCKSEGRPASPLSLLTRAQYDATITDLLGDGSRPSASFPPENEVAGFNNNTEVHIANPSLVEQLMAAAEGIAGRAVAANLSGLAPCAGSGLAEQVECGKSFVSTFGKRAFRRPLVAEESRAFETLFAGIDVSRGYASAVELTVQAMLQSPQFLYRADSKRAATPETGAVALDGYQLASRLSYFLVGSMPDAPLFAAADSGKLANSAEIEEQARRLLEGSKARAMVRDFNQHWLRLDQLAGLARTEPDDQTELKGIGEDYRESLQQFLDHVYWDTGDLSSLFLAPATFVNGRLAKLFGLEAKGSGFVSAGAAPGQVGLLTQPALMAMLAHSDQSGPVQRGVFVREQILCIPVPPPPPNFNPVAPDPDPSLTTRARFAVHTQSSACAGCHALIDGTGFGFESYDQLGRYRTMENGLPIDDSGEMLGSDEAELDGPFRGAAELSRRIAKSPRAQNCLATNWFRYAMGRVETDADGCSLLDVQRKFSASGGRFKELLVALTLTDAFRYRPAMLEDQ